MKNLYNLSTHQVIKILSVLCNVYIAPKKQNKFLFYVNNYIGWDQFNHLYNPEFIEKSKKNANAVACKLKLALTKIINDRLKVVEKKRQKREKMIKKQKIKIMAIKCQRLKEGISLSSKYKKNYNNHTGDEIYLD